MKSLSFLALLFFYFESTNAFILKPTTILTKAVENAGSGVYILEQEVSFQGAGEPFVLNELWSIENAEKMKLIVTGTKELKDKLHWVFIYDHGFRTQILSNKKFSKKNDLTFIERYFFVRKSNDLQAYLVQTQAVPSSLFAKNPYRLGSKDPDVVSDPNLRLARVGGSIAYAFGKPSLQSSDTPSAFFFEQDTFVLRKFRIGNAEVLSENFSNYTRGLVFPRLRTIKWNENIVVIQTQQITPRSEKTISVALEQSTENDLAEAGSLKSIVEEFYKRFR